MAKKPKPAAKKKTIGKKTAKKKTTASTKQDKKVSPEAKQDTVEKQKKDAPKSENVDIKPRFYLVAVGASAGGIDALTKFFSNLPDDTGAAFVIITHLLPGRKSNMDEIISKVTSMPVQQAENGMELKPGNVYLNTPGTNMGIMNGRLYLRQRTERGPSYPINHFYQAMAEDFRENSIGIVLSGTGSDGTLGLKAIKEHLGMIMVQSPLTAGFSGMPQSALDTGLADFQEAPEAMGKKLKKYILHSRKRIKKVKRVEEAFSNEDLSKILYILRKKTGHDFSSYKHSTIVRRIWRRLDVQQMDDISQYINYLQESPHEAKILFKELLINVTSFFRDPDSFDALKKKAFPILFQNRQIREKLRIWVPGVATGEEAYSIAIALHEYMSENHTNENVQIFATDLDEESINNARHGTYHAGIAGDVGAERLEKYFEKSEGAYTIRRAIREMVIFAVQNIVKDPPFTNINMISCRNLLIYLNSEMQDKLMTIFHYSLVPNGILLLGSSESVGSYIDLFSTIDKKWKVYQRKPYTEHFPRKFEVPQIYETRPAGRDLVESAESNLEKSIQKILLESFIPPCAITNSDGHIIYIHGRTGKYLEPSPGRASMNIIDMARPGLKSIIKPELRNAALKGRESVHRNVAIKNNGGTEYVNLSVRPISISRNSDRLILVSFEDVPSSEKIEKERKTSKKYGKSAKSKNELEEELERTRDELQATIKEQEISNEELQSMNEEYQSTNEELKSANEELETSREELQSLNEELSTVNMELQEKIDNISKTYENMNIFLDSLKIPIIFLDNDLCIVRFTDSAKDLVHLIPGDVGRPLQHITTNLEDHDLVKYAHEVQQKMRNIEKEVKTKAGKWYLLRVLPYKTADSGFPGVVINFVDINELKQMGTKLETASDALNYAESILETIQVPLVVLDNDLKVISANTAYYQWFRATKDETVGRNFFDLAKGQWDTSELKNQFEKILPEKYVIEDYLVETKFPRIGTKKILINARRLMHDGAYKNHILISMQEADEQE